MSHAPYRPAPSLADEAAAAFDTLLATLPAARVQPVDLPGAGSFWLKRAETLSFRLRLQKGDPRRALEAERRGLHILGDLGLPVPDIVAEGADFLLIPDCGPTLLSVLKDPARGADERAMAFAAAGRSLGQLHVAGFAHGRPALRDICWDGAEARLIDLERFRRRRMTLAAQAADVVMFAQSWFTARPDGDDGLAAFLGGYLDTAGEAAVLRAQRLARALGWLALLARALRRLRPTSRELRAVPLALGWLRAAPCPGSSAPRGPARP